MNRTLQILKHAIASHSDDDIVHIQARTLAAGLGDEAASSLCLRPVSLKEEEQAFEKACADTVATLREDRATLLEQIELGLGGFGKGHVAEIDREIQAAATGSSVSLALYPVRVGRLRDLIAKAEAAPKATKKEGGEAK